MNPLNYNKYLFFTGMLFTIHNTEEAIGTAYFVLPSYIKLPIELPNPTSMIWAIILVTIIAWVAIIGVVKRNSEANKRDLLTFFSLVFLFNAVFPHILAAIVCRCYTPAAISSALLYIPFSVWSVPKLYRQYQDRKQFYRVIWVGAVVSLIIVGALLRITAFIFS